MPNISQGPLLCTATLAAGMDTPWSNVGFLAVDDGTSFAECDQNAVGAGTKTQTAQGTGFGFGIPSGSTIQGFTFSIKKQAQKVVDPDTGQFFPYTAPIDYEAYALKAGGVPVGAVNHANMGVGGNGADAISWPLSLAPIQKTYGGMSDKWGVSWSNVDINDPGFGMIISAVSTFSQPTFPYALGNYFLGALYATVFYQTVITPGYGGVTAFERIGLYPMSDGNLYSFDPNSGYDDHTDGSSYFWRVEEIAVGRKPTISRIFVTYRDLGRVTTVWTLTAVDDSQKVVTNSATKVLGNATPTGFLMTAEIDLPLSGMNMQLSVSRAAGAGPLSIAKVKICGRVETDRYS